MESPLGVKGEQEIRLVDCCHPMPTCISHQGFLFLYLSCFISFPNSNVSMGKKETGNEVKCCPDW